ncbi:MAG TPA: hypothetical protein VKQ08_04790 [Cyclobacteriaceae bacterium]|nr:hypothetical protein [Cyclobacteriaceae bacterium]
MNGGTPPKIDLSTVVEVRPDELEKSYAAPPSFLTQAGYRLAKMTLFIISGVIVFAMLFIIFKQLSAQDPIHEISKLNPLDDASFQRKLDLYKLVQEERKSFREFIVQILQMILLNLLLPILTAILGYIFGSSSEKK